MVRQVVFEKTGEIPEQSGFSVVSQFVSGNGDGLILYVENDGSEKVNETFESGIGVFPKTQMSDSQKFRLLTLSDGSQKVVDLPALNVTFPFVDVFPDGRVLVAGSRSRWRGSDDFDLNGIVVDAAAGSQRSFLLGDGIETLAVDLRGRIWVSYFDEGIFGNFGWGHPGPAPIGSSGLNCFSDSGDLLWSFPVESEMGPISDCYAMNVSGDRVAVYAYTEFNVWRISERFETECFKTDLQGCHHFAMSDSHIVFTGQYDDEISVGYVGRLSDGRVCDVEQMEFALPRGREIKAGQFVGRADMLHFFDESNWYSIHIDAVA